MNSKGRHGTPPQDITKTMFLLNQAWRDAKEFMKVDDIAGMMPAMEAAIDLSDLLQRQYGCTCDTSWNRECQHGVASCMEVVCETEREGDDGEPEYDEGIPCTCQCHELIDDAKFWRPSEAA